MKPKGLKKNNFLKGLTFIVLLLATFFFCIISWIRIDFDNFTIGKFPELLKEQYLPFQSRAIKETISVSAYNSKGVSSFAVYKGSLLHCTSQWIRQINADNKESWFIPLDLSKPYVLIWKDTIIVADIGGRTLIGIENGKIVWRKTLKQKLYNISVSDGFITTVCSPALNGFKAAVSLYSIKGQKIQTLNISNYIPYQAQTFKKDDKTRILVNGITTDGLYARSIFEMFSLYADDPEVGIHINGLYPCVLFTQNGLLIANDRRIMFYDYNFNKLWAKEEDSIASIKLYFDKYIAYVLTREDNYYKQSEKKSSVICLVDKSGRKVWTYKNHTRVLEMDSFRDLIALVEKRGVSFLNSRGMQIYHYNAKADIKKFLLINKRKAVIISDDKISFVRIGK